MSEESVESVFQHACENERLRTQVAALEARMREAGEQKPAGVVAYEISHESPADIPHYKGADVFTADKIAAYESHGFTVRPLTYADPVPAQTAADVAAILSELASLRRERDESRRLLDEARAQVPVAYMHNKRADVIHTSVKSLLSDFAVNSGPESMLRPIDKAEHYTIPLYAAPVPAQPAAAKGSTHCDDCGCDWLDNGLNPIGCPYCKRNNDKLNPCLNSLVRQVSLMMDDCEQHADGRITIDCDISQGFLRRIYDLLSALEDSGYDAIEPQPAVPEAVAKDAADKLALAYGYLWHVNNSTPGYDAPSDYTRPQLTPKDAAYKARGLLRDMLTNDQRGDGINRAAILSAADTEVKK